ncbi:sensor histidine kinase [Desulforamulus aquiferis]|uniref:histidine kinase n=1 Tax=Desulforamulus aquiferis TaxID=1397668 RepID=A0AAW7ZBA1_9FIRM|nr:sensor histidine kinase [Desulforamulus aquiferis]MDO7786568.1 sensor histidine kinase [Desulforamulus aquiferis]
MKENSFLWVALYYLRSRKEAIGLGFVFHIIFVVIFYLYSLEFEALAYAFLLSACIATVFMVYDFIKYYKKHSELRNLAKHIRADLQRVPSTSDLIEANYQDILLAIYDEKKKMISKVDSKQTEMVDYFTLWVHQIKTPIAAMRLLVQSEHREQYKELLEQILRIEQYVEMVLGYIKIDNSSSDLVLERHNLLELVKQSIRKYAHLFIKKNIVLELQEKDCIVLTDEKWLVFVIEQILSNALKYTNGGKISIYIVDEERKLLVIEDTGIGIAEEDLPRVFEKGFTGYNGRMDKKATGIGLYLCKKILDKLSHTIIITSNVNVGTRVEIDFSSTKTIFE